MTYLCSKQRVPKPPGGLRFQFEEQGEVLSGFVVHWEDEYYAFENRCVHMQLELDWNAGLFFDVACEKLICSTHAARFDPESGFCVSGPCKGGSLRRLPSECRGNDLYIGVAGQLSLETGAFRLN